MRALTTTILAGALFACSTGDGPTGPIIEPSPAPEAPTARTAPDVIHTAAEGIERDRPATRGVDVGEGTAIDLMPAPELATRPRRRMDLEQLSQAMVQVSDGVGWTERRGNRDVNLFDELSATLGRPDYIQVTTEDLEPSALFLKFLDDAARSICARSLIADMDLRTPEERVLLVHASPGDGWADAPEDIDANIAWLVQRFHGRTVAESSASVAAWRWLFRSVEFVTSDPMESWMAICVGLYTHPDFYSY